jgi:hypothetical protein
VGIVVQLFGENASACSQKERTTAGKAAAGGHLGFRDGRAYLTVESIRRPSISIGFVFPKRKMLYLCIEEQS